MKQKPHTPFVTALLKKALGEDADTGSLPVFEVVATSSRPLKKNGIYKDAVITNLTIAQMAAAVNHDPLPLMVDHNMEGSPKGKFFYAEARQENGIPELRGMFYIDPTEPELVAKANTGTLDETSVGFLPSSIKCSSCKWDYMAALKAGNYEPFMTLTCENGHSLGKGGVHAEVDGLEDFMELSLVSRGAAPNSKIIGNNNARLDQHVERLAASGFDVTELYLTASASTGDNKVDIAELITQLSDVKATAAVDKATLTLRAENAETALTTVQASLTAKDTEIAELTTQLAAAKEASAPTEDAAALEAANTFLKDQYTAVLTASGETDIVVPDNMTDVIEGIKAHRAKLSAIFPIGGVSNTANTSDEKNKDASASLSAFKSRKN